MTDPVLTDAPAGPVRTCLGCRRRDEQPRLLRIVADGATVVVDPRRRAPGRGAYVHPDPGCVATAVKRRAFARALRTTVDATAAGAVLTAYLEGLEGPAPTSVESSAGTARGALGTPGRTG